MVDCGALGCVLDCVVLIRSCVLSGMLGIILGYVRAEFVLGCRVLGCMLHCELGWVCARRYSAASNYG